VQAAAGLHSNTPPHLAAWAHSDALGRPSRAHTAAMPPLRAGRRPALAAAAAVFACGAARAARSSPAPGAVHVAALEAGDAAAARAEAKQEEV
jgi:hypothetical protein